jgi:hypothetical protein
MPTSIPALLSFLNLRVLVTSQIQKFKLDYQKLLAQLSDSLLNIQTWFTAFFLWAPESNPL